MIGDVRTLPVAERAEEIFAIETALCRVLSHSLGLLKVDVASNFLQFSEVLHVFDQLIMGTIETSIDVDLVLMHVEWCL